MSWSFCPSADDFARLRRKSLLTNESTHCLTWGAISRSAKSASGPGRYRLLTYGEGKNLTAHAVIDHHSDELILAAMNEQQVTALLCFLDRQSIEPHRLFGPREATRRFADKWQKSAHRHFQVEMKQALYEVREVRTPTPAGGRLVLASPPHSERVTDFLTGFVSECFPTEEHSATQLKKRADRLITEQKGFLWEDADETIVSMAAIVRESPNTTSISLVYTPRESRGQGHAACVVAALSQAHLDAGKVACNLHTDLSNPTSNRVYSRIGYELIQHNLRVRLFKTPKQ